MTIALPPGFRLVALDRVGSTNDEAKTLARAGAPGRTLVWAREQTEGRGRRGRGWTSPPGNLYCSLLLRPDRSPDRATQLGFIAALAIGETVGGFAPPAIDLHLKWPNDVLLGGRKVSGILLESQSGPEGKLDWLVLGMGVNIASAPSGTEFPATSLAEAGCRGLGVEPVLERLVLHLDAWIERWLAEGFAPVRTAWRGRAWRLGETIEARLPKENATGRFVDLDEDGALILETAGARRHISTADVFPAAA